MPLVQKTQQQFVGDLVASWGVNAGVVPALQTGDVLLAAFQALSVQFDFVQAEIKQVLLFSRAQTATGPDLDSFFADFGFLRLPASSATGPETFSKNQPSQQPVIIPPGVQVQSQGGAIVFQTVADPAQPRWNPTIIPGGAYVLAAGATSLTATIQAVAPGTAYNVSPGALNQLATSLPGIDSVTNPALIINGKDAETDADFRTRWVQYFATLAQGTQSAIRAAIAGVQQNLNVSLNEFMSPTNVPQIGAFAAIVDDGSGDPPAALITALQTAVDKAKAFGVRAIVSPPIDVPANIVLAVRIAVGANTNAVVNAVVIAVQTAILQTTIGGVLFVSNVELAALAVPGVVSVRAGTTINGLAADLAALPNQVIRPGTISAGLY